MGDQPVWAFAGYWLTLTSGLLRSAILPLMLMLMLQLLLMIITLLLIPAQSAATAFTSDRGRHPPKDIQVNYGKSNHYESSQNSGFAKILPILVRWQI